MFNCYVEVSGAVTVAYYVQLGVVTILILALLVKLRCFSPDA